MITFNLDNLNQKAKEKPSGYKEDVLKHSTLIDPKNHVYSLDMENFHKLREKYSGKTNFQFKIKSFFKHIYFNVLIFFQTRKVKVSRKVRDDRWKICSECPQLNDNKKCQLCGCYMPLKTWLVYAVCPANKWN